MLLLSKGVWAYTLDIEAGSEVRAQATHSEMDGRTDGPYVHKLV